VKNLKKCAVGLVGAGNVARRHARVLAGFADVRLAGVTDVRADAARELADEHGTRAYPDVGALLDAEPDAVYVCVPPFAHGPAEEAVLAAGLPMFVEKPLAADLATAERIAPRAEGVVTAVGHHWRYLAVVELARDLLEDRPVHLVVGAWLDKVPPVAWWTSREASGGPVVEQAAHVLDLARLLAGEVVQVRAVAGEVLARVPSYAESDNKGPFLADVDAATAATLSFASGAVGSLTTACVLGWKHRAGIQVYAEGLALSIDENRLVVRDGVGEERMAADVPAAHRAVDRAFVDAVLGVADDVRCPYGEALRTHRLACAIAQSAATGEAIDV
jgi:myo-inositol 2-dehydrogenase/D-chiro-inositol 1-dehydrogenase